MISLIHMMNWVLLHNGWPVVDWVHVGAVLAVLLEVLVGGGGVDCAVPQRVQLQVVPKVQYVHLEVPSFVIMGRVLQVVWGL